jgi:hypothetical protein
MTVEAATTATPAAPASEGAAPPSGATEGAAAPPPPAEPSHVQDAAKKASYVERRNKALAIFKGGAPAAPTIVGPGTAEPPAEPAPESADAETEPPAPAAKAKAEPEKADPKAEAAHARALAALRKEEAEKLRLKSELDKAESARKADIEAERAETAKLRAQLEALMKDPVAALKAAGKTADQFMREVVEGKIKPPAPEDELREQVQSKLTPLEQELARIKAELDAEKAAKAEREQAEQQKAVREKDLGVVKSVVTADEYPITAALGAYDVVLNACYQTGSQDVAAKAAEFEAHQVQLLETLLTPKLLAALEKRSPKIRETVGALRGPAQSRQAAVSSGGPRVAARDVVSAPSTPVERPKTPEERKARALQMLKGAS